MLQSAKPNRPRKLPELTESTQPDPAQRPPESPDPSRCIVFGLPYMLGDKLSVAK